MITRPLDTTHEGWQIQREALARLGGEARVRTAIELSETVRTLRLEGVLARNPRWSRAEAIRSLIGSAVETSRGGR